MYEIILVSEEAYGNMSGHIAGNFLGEVDCGICQRGAINRWREKAVRLTAFSTINMIVFTSTH